MISKGWFFAILLPLVSGGDVDPCDLLQCSQTCIKNQIDHPYCGCIQGFRISERDPPTSCVPIDSQLRLIYSTNKGIQMSYNGTEKLLTPTNFTTIPYSIACDARHQTIFWSDSNPDMGRIYKLSLNQMGKSQIEEIVETGITSHSGISFDWITGNLYATDYLNSRIILCGNASNLCTVLVEGIKANEIAVIPNQSKMVWLQKNQNDPQIIISDMDGSSQKVLVESYLNSTHSIAVDEGAMRIYWIDLRGDRIMLESVKLDGEDMRVPITSISDSPLRPRGIDVFGDKIYLNDLNQECVLSADKRTGENVTQVTKIHADIHSMNGLTIMENANQPITRSNPCEAANCSHICALAEEGNFRCLCPVGMTLENDGRICKEIKGIKKLAVGINNQLKIMKLGSIGRDVFETVTLKVLRKISAIAYNPISDKLILSDSILEGIYECSLDGDVHLLVGNVEVNKMDFDPISENLYWVDHHGKLEVMSLQTKARVEMGRVPGGVTDILVISQLERIYISSKLEGVGGAIHKMLMSGGELRSSMEAYYDEYPMALAFDKGSSRVVGLFLNKLDKKFNIRSLQKSGNVSYSSNTYISPPSDFIIHNGNVYLIDGTLIKYSNNLWTKTIKINGLDKPSTKTNLAILDTDVSDIQAFISNHECSWQNPKKMHCPYLCFAEGGNMTGTCYCPTSKQDCNENYSAKNNDYGDIILVVLFVISVVVVCFLIFKPRNQRNRAIIPKFFRK